MRVFLIASLVSVTTSCAESPSAVPPESGDPVEMEQPAPQAKSKPPAGQRPSTSEPAAASEPSAAKESEAAAKEPEGAAAGSDSQSSADGPTPAEAGGTAADANGLPAYSDKLPMVTLYYYNVGISAYPRHPNTGATPIRQAEWTLLASPAEGCTAEVRACGATQSLAFATPCAGESSGLLGYACGTNHQGTNELRKVEVNMTGRVHTHYFIAAIPSLSPGEATGVFVPARLMP